MTVDGYDVMVHSSVSLHINNLGPCVVPGVGAVTWCGGDMGAVTWCGGGTVSVTLCGGSMDAMTFCGGGMDAVTCCGSGVGVVTCCGSGVGVVTWCGCGDTHWPTYGAVNRLILELECVSLNVAS